MYRLLVWSAIAGLVLASPEVLAERFAVETYVGKRPADAESVMKLVRPILEARRFNTRPDALRSLFADHGARPALADAGFDGARWSTSVENGVNAYIDASEDRDFDKVVVILGPALASARRNPLALAREPKFREEMSRALIYYALARGRQARSLTDRTAAATSVGERNVLSKKATEAANDRDVTMAELIRSFPSKLVTAKDFGNEAEALFKRARHDLDKLGRARIEVDAGDPDTVIYLDEMVQARGKIAVGDLVPGRERVLLQSARGDSLVYDIELLPNQTSRLTADLELDSKLVLDPWVGFEYASDNEHASEPELIARLARGTGVILAAALTVGRRAGHPTVTCTYYGARSGKIARAGTVTLDGRDDVHRLEQLFAYLETGVQEADVTAVR